MITTSAVRYPVSSVVAVGLMAGFFIVLFTIVSQRSVPVVVPVVDQIRFTPLIHEKDPVPPPKWIKEEPIVPHPKVVFDGSSTEGPTLDPVADLPRGVFPNPPTEFQSRVDSSPGPLVRPDPVYPRKAIERSIEGWVELQFTISGSGAVTDVMVVDAEPKGVFDAAATKALQSWKYAPRIREGRAVEQRGMRVVLRFDLD